MVKYIAMSVVIISQSSSFKIKKKEVNQMMMVGQFGKKMI